MNRYKLIFKRTELGFPNTEYKALVGTLEQINEKWTEVVYFNDYLSYSKPEFVKIEMI